MHFLRHVAAWSAAPLRAVLRRQTSLRSASNSAAALEKVGCSQAKQSKPRLQDLRKRLLEDDALSSPRQFVSQNAPDCNADAPGNTAAHAGTADSTTSVQQQVQAQIAQAVAAFPHIDFNDSSSRAVLRDSFGRQHNYLRISLTERCNLRCTYCMPEEGVELQGAGKMLSRDEIIQLATLFAECGVDKIRLTGGEPTLRNDLLDIVSALSSIPGIREVGMTTNAVTLKPRLQADLRDAGLTAVNISLDTLVAEKFAQITRRSPKILGRVMSAIEECADFFPGRVKVNCVVMKGFNDDELQDFVRLGRNIATDIRFIEWMPFSGNKWDERFMSFAEMQRALEAPEVPGGPPPDFELRRDVDGENDTTKWWRARSVGGHGGSDFLGRVGFITSMSANFCSSCNRLRLMADGKIKVCLFGEEELSLRDALREPTTTEAGMRALIHSAVARKTFALGGHGDMHGIAASAGNRPMTLIGG